jgi:hypothetical protein
MEFLCILTAGVVLIINTYLREYVKFFFVSDFFLPFCFLHLLPLLFLLIFFFFR